MHSSALNCHVFHWKYYIPRLIYFDSLHSLILKDEGQAFWCYSYIFEDRARKGEDIYSALPLTFVGVFFFGFLSFFWRLRCVVVSASASYAEAGRRPSYSAVFESNPNCRNENLASSGAWEMKGSQAWRWRHHTVLCCQVMAKFGTNTIFISVPGVKKHL